MSKRNKVLVGTGAAVLLFGLVAISAGARRDRGQEVRFDKVARRDLVAAVTASGKIQPKKKVDISADITGRITKIAVREGDFVKQGQFLADRSDDLPGQPAAGCRQPGVVAGGRGAGQGQPGSGRARPAAHQG